MFEINNELAQSFHGLDQLLAVYSELDALIEEFKNKMQIDCVEKCKKCCGTAGENIEVSVFEVLPMSIYFWQKGEAEDWLDKLEKATPATPCVLFHNDPLAKSGCSAYFWRPLLCRLFGFSAKLDKNGKPLIGLCKELKQKDVFLEKRVQEKINEAEGEAIVPINSHFAQKIAAINPHLGQQRYSINTALKEALEIVGFRLSLMASTGGDFDHNPHDDHPPKGPHLGKSA